MTFEQEWLEYDYNPFILFSSNGKIISLNSEAQFLLGSANTQELFELATTYANVTFGFKTTFLNLEFGRYKFFGITVGYQNEDEIGIKFYQTPTFIMDKPKIEGEFTNIYTLVDLCISTHSINTKINFTKDFDPTIPEIMINSNTFVKLLNKVYDSFKENESICTKIYFRIGEHIKFDGKKYTLFSVEVSSKQISKVQELKAHAENSNFFLDIQNNTATINIPMITK